MILIEQTTVPPEALPVQAFKEHLRLGTGFADDGTQDGLAEAFLRAAIAAIEGRTGKALLTREFRWSLYAWRDEAAQALPLAPVTMITSVTMYDRDGLDTVVDRARYQLMADTHRPKVAATGAILPGIPVGGSVDIVFEAGFGFDWAEVPPDLAQAVFLLAAHYYEHRSEGSEPKAMPFGVMSLIERWRNVRVLGGGGA
ncbi:MAG: head-tail connector protein [Paracoccaceae bacterium]